MIKNLNSVSRSMSFVARLAATYILLFAAAMVNGGLAEEPALILSQSGVPADDAGSTPHSASDNITAAANAEDQGERKFEGRGVIRHNGTDTNPADASTTVPAVSELARAIRKLDWRKLEIIGAPRDTRHKPFQSATKGEMIRNAIGLAIQTQQSRQGPDRGIFKRTVAHGAGGVGENISSAPNVSAASTHGSDLGSQTPLPFNVNRARINIPPLNTAVNHSIISGKSIGRPALGIGMIGGATKNVMGVVSGTNIHPKHP